MFSVVALFLSLCLHVHITVHPALHMPNRLLSKKKVVSRMIARADGGAGARDHKTDSLERRCASAGRGGERCQTLEEI